MENSQQSIQIPSNIKRLDVTITAIIDTSKNLESTAVVIYANDHYDKMAACSDPKYGVPDILEYLKQVKRINDDPSKNQHIAVSIDYDVINEFLRDIKSENPYCPDFVI